MTEFLPISSSGHLVLGQTFLGIKQPGNEFEILVHLGTLASILVIFFQDIKSIIQSISERETQRFVLFLFIGTLPAVLIGLGFKDFLGGLFENPKAVSGALLFTGMVLFTSVFFNEKAGNRTYLQGLLIGCAQA
ncbi:MAG: undecaprenyl-diphosphate phosphatase, partial [Desulfobacterales bacterium]|nr:undecaprenyl-diphosphate phosphatase [Desulfobacterales bacterium]